MEVKSAIRSTIFSLESIEGAKGTEGGQMWYLENYLADLLDLGVILKASE